MFNVDNLRSLPKVGIVYGYSNMSELPMKAFVDAKFDGIVYAGVGNGNFYHTPLVAHIRDNGSMNAVISTETIDIDVLKAKLKEIPNMKGLELASKVSVSEPYFFGNENAKYKVAALDFGIKNNILRNMAKRDMYIKVFPYNTPLSKLKSWNPDGYFLSNGPGDPEPLTEVIAQVKQMIAEDLPIFGICLGHQIIALANDIPTYKMHNGHR